MFASLVMIVLIGVLVHQWRQIRSAQHPQKLRVRELAVVDERGTERVLIAAPLPEPMIMGKRGKRGGKISGIIILDATGTSVEVMIQATGTVMPSSHSTARELRPRCCLLIPMVPLCSGSGTRTVQ